MKRRSALAAVLLSFLLLRPCLPAAASGERILSYNSHITVQVDRSVIVRETIKVVAAGDQIKRGIYRFFPTRYRNRFGNKVKVAFDVLEVLKDGRPESFHRKSDSRGEKVYIGKSDVFLDPGEYTYTLSYRTDRQIGFFEEFDELYWNVTGNEWAFPMEKVSAEVRLPEGATVLNFIAYTGPEGGKGEDYTASRDGERGVKFACTRPLAMGEGLTIAVSWPKGVIPEPTAEERAADIMRDNPSGGAALGGLLLVLVYYGCSWLIVGKDPPRGTIVTAFSPPDGYSPAAVRYVMKMGYSDKVFAAAVVSMAVKGFLTIDEEDTGFTLTKTGSDLSVLSRGERKIAGKLFPSKKKKISLEKANHARIGKAVTALKKYLKTEFHTLNFKTNSRWILPGVVLTVVALGGVVFTAGNKPEAAFMSVWLSFWSIGTFVLLTAVVKAWKGVRTTDSPAGCFSFGAALFVTLFALPFFSGEVIGLFMFSRATSPVAAAILLLIVAVNAVFIGIIKAPTVQGRRVMDEIDGFKVFLEATEQDRMERLHSPEKTPELFEKFLPYAIALDVENAWANKFSTLLSRSAEGGGTYRPGWYSGGSPDSFEPGAMVSSLGSSLSKTISSSSTPPGSGSGGSSGGGSSGGGGGGGGGGGW